MKKNLLFLLVFSFSFVYCYSQPNNNIENLQIKKELNDSVVKLKRQISSLKNKLIVSDSVYNSHFNILSLSLDSTKKSIDDTRLRESLKSAEHTISFQNSFIQIFAVIFGIIAFLSGFLYFFSIKPLTKQADLALDRANSATDKFENKIIEFNKQLDEKINTRFDLYEKELNEKKINEIFVDIESDLQNQRKLQIERLTTLGSSLTSDKIDRLFKVIDNKELSLYEKRTIIEVLIQENSYQIQMYFAVWKNLNKEEISIIDLLYRYYMNNGIEKFLVPISHFVLIPLEPHLEFNRLLDMLPSYPDDIIHLINCRPLIDSLNKHSRESIINHLNEGMKSWSLVEKDKVEISYLYQKD
ncbi:MAG: hypothetical protein A2W99_06360 [Bacteroidetes bacterium GWF2_33_16]|nr:MAG: hypothetical protein A2X00_11050 [Bacteroidetes bacterium GWE2_32_14]OFY05302.1 MAG: hypothetical protein A2W99_06360 [Bacteroidetes bacterium GWF2_33_16]